MAKTTYSVDRIYAIKNWAKFSPIDRGFATHLNTNGSFFAILDFQWFRTFAL